jgi:hypothetical protein
LHQKFTITPLFGFGVKILPQTQTQTGTCLYEYPFLKALIQVILIKMIENLMGEIF